MWHLPHLPWRDEIGPPKDIAEGSWAEFTALGSSTDPVLQDFRSQELLYSVFINNLLEQTVHASALPLVRRVYMFIFAGLWSTAYVNQLLKPISTPILSICRDLSSHLAESVDTIIAAEPELQWAAEGSTDKVSDKIQVY